MYLIFKNVKILKLHTVELRSYESRRDEPENLITFFSLKQGTNILLGFNYSDKRYVHFEGYVCSTFNAIIWGKYFKINFVRLPKYILFI